jgi:Flp pilus assembly protein TadD
VEVDEAAWVGLLAQGDASGRAGRWDEAAEAVERAIAAGAGSLEAWSRLALFQLRRGDVAGYRRCCVHLMSAFGTPDAAPVAANNVAWACALGPDAGVDPEAVVELAERGVRGRPELNRMNTLGAALYRAGRHVEALARLEQAVGLHGAGGTPYDAMFLAMTHQVLGHPEEARQWLGRAAMPAPIRMNKPDLGGPSTWIPGVELGLLREEAVARIEGGPPGGASTTSAPAQVHP